MTLRSGSRCRLKAHGPDKSMTGESIVRQRRIWAAKIKADRPNGPMRIFCHINRRDEMGPASTGSRVESLSLGLEGVRQAWGAANASCR